MDGKLAYDLYQSRQGQAIAWVDREAWKYEEAASTPEKGVRSRAAMRLIRFAVWLQPSLRQSLNAGGAVA